MWRVRCSAQRSFTAPELVPCLIGRAIVTAVAPCPLATRAFTASVRLAPGTMSDIYRLQAAVHYTTGSQALQADQTTRCDAAIYLLLYTVAFDRSISCSRWLAFIPGPRYNRAKRENGRRERVISVSAPFKNNRAAASAFTIHRGSLYTHAAHAPCWDQLHQLLAAAYVNAAAGVCASARFVSSVNGVGVLAGRPVHGGPLVQAGHRCGVIHCSPQAVRVADRSSLISLSLSHFFLAPLCLQDNTWWWRRL